MNEMDKATCFGALFVVIIVLAVTVACPLVSAASATKNLFGGLFLFLCLCGCLVSARMFLLSLLKHNEHSNDHESTDSY